MIQHFTTKSYFHDYAHKCLQAQFHCISLHPGVRVERCCSPAEEVCDHKAI